MPVLNIVGAFSPFVDETVTLNGKLNPINTTWMKIQVTLSISTCGTTLTLPLVQDAAMVLEEQPGKVSEAFLLFVQGQGFCLNVRRKTCSISP